MNEASISVIQKYIDECLFEPRLKWPKYYFTERSYSRWAAYEIQERIIEEALRLPPHITGREPRSLVDIIKAFISEMDDLSETSDNKRFQLIFLIARDTAEDILCLFL